MEGGNILFRPQEDGWRSYNGKENKISNSGSCDENILLFPDEEEYGGKMKENIDSELLNTLERI